MSFYTTEKNKKNVGKFIDFLEEKNLSSLFTELMKEKIRGDLIGISRDFPEMSIHRAVTSKHATWYGELIGAIIDSSRTAAPRNIGSNFDLFGLDDAEQLTSQITVKTRFDQGITISGAEFSSRITFHSEDEDILKLLEVREVGGEITTEGGGEEDEKKTYALNASRGSEMTSRIESRISDALKTYLATNSKDIDEEISNKFEEWASKNNVEISKGK